MENVSLIEILSEDDLLIPSSLQEFGIHTGSTIEAEKIETQRQNLEEVPHLSGSPEQSQKISDRYNLRKSLAWDSAFLTGEGILNPEELANMNNRRSKAGMALPVINELRKSSESTSTSESDSWAMENLEMNLFDSVRDSVQRSLGSSNHTKNMVHCEKIKEKRKPYAPNARTLKKIDDSSEIQLKTTTALRRHDVTRQYQGHTPKDSLVCMSLPSHGNAESKPLIRPPKVSSKTILLPASVPGKKASTEIKEIKGSTAKQQSIVALNKRNAVPGITPRTTLSRKPTYGSQTSSLGSSSSILTTSSSDSKSVSSLVTVEKSTKRSSSSSSRTGKTPLNISINGSTVKSHNQNLSKPSLVLSNISPVSSIDCIASETSSSTSMKLGNSFEGSDAVSSSSVAFSSSLDVFRSSGSLSQPFIDDRSKSYKNGDCGSKFARPSGLRVPRPTVGYFDKERTLIRGSKNKAPKAILQNNLKNSNINNMQPINLPTVEDKKLPSSLSKQVSKSAKVNFQTKMENHQKLCPKVNKISSKTIEKNCKMNFKDEQVPTDEVEKVQSCNVTKKEEVNLLHNDYQWDNENEINGEQNTHYQSCVTHNQQENAKNDRTNGGTEKENVSPQSKTEDLNKMQQTEVAIGGDVLSFTF